MTVLPSPGHPPSSTVGMKTVETKVIVFAFLITREETVNDPFS